MRKGGPRWYGFGAPLACLAGMLFGDFESTVMMIGLYYMAQICSLAAPDAFSRAAARQMSTKKVMGSLMGAVILTLIPAVILFFTVCEAEPSQLIVLSPIVLMVITRCFEELFASQNDSASATITTALTAIFLGGALSLVGSHSYGDPESAAELAATGIVAAISGSIALGFSRREKPTPNFAILKQVPAAMVRLLLYPALCIGLLIVNGRFGAGMPVWRAAVCSGLIGLIFLELSKSTFRRGKYESAGLKTGTALSMLCATGGLLVISTFFWRSSLPLCQALILTAGASAMLLYAPWDWESIAATLVMLAAAAVIVIGVTPEAYSFPFEILIAPAASLIVCAIMFRQWRALTRGARANRIRKKAMKRTK